MNNKIILFLVFAFAYTANSQSLNGAWKLIEKDGVAVDYEMIKLHSDLYFTYAAYHKSTGEFIEAGGGTYQYEFFNYKENYEIDSTNPERSGTTTSYKAIMEGENLRITNLSTGEVQKWLKIDEADNKLMATCWRIHKKQDEGDPDWRRIEYAPRKTLKLLTNHRYQVLALNSETGKFVGSSGGTWTSNDQNYIEHIEFFSKDPSNVGRELSFYKKIDHDLWHHSGRDTQGQVLMEKWLRYK